MIEEIQAAKQVVPVLQRIADGATGITHIGTERTTEPADHESWVVSVRTNDGQAIDFWMEGSVVHQVLRYQVGDQTVFENNRINILSELTSDTINKLTGAIMDALRHVIAIQ